MITRLSAWLVSVHCAAHAGSSDSAWNASAIDPGVRSIRYAWPFYCEVF